MQERVVGKAAIRKEGLGKVCGRARYIDDLSFPGLLHGATVRSSIARGRILGIEFEAGVDPAVRKPFIAVSGIDKEAVGQQAAVIRKLRPPEPYKGKGVRYRGEVVRRKAGKTAKGGGKGGKKK